MSGFLTGLVQRGASLPGRAAEPALVAAPLAPAEAAAASPLEMAANVMDVPVTSPSAHVDLLGATPMRAHVEHAQPPADVHEQHVVHVTHVTTSMLREHVEVPVIEPTRAVPGLDVTPSDTGGRAPESTAPLHSPVQQMKPSPGVAGQPSADRVTVALDPSAAADAQSPRVNHAQAVPHEERPAATPRLVTAMAPWRAEPVEHELPEVPIEAAPSALAEPRVETRVEPPTRIAQAPPIHVRIGKVEVRPAAPAAIVSAAPRNGSASPVRGFAAYRRLRTYRN